MEDGMMIFVMSGPGTKTDPSFRTLIRKQVMKRAAIERKKRNKDKRVNLGQLPPLEDATESLVQDGAIPEQVAGTFTRPKSDDEIPVKSHEISELKNPAPTATSHWGRHSSELPTLPVMPPIPALQSAYEMARSRFQIDINDLSMLTSFNIGYGTHLALAADPGRLRTLMGHLRWSYLQFVPSYYGFSDCLTAATDCLLAKVRNLLSAVQTSQELQLKLHAKALKLIQCAVQDARSCMDSDVLCASQLLSLYELLDSKQDRAWTQHIQGSSQLIKHRTSDRFTSEFDKALFAGHLGPIVMEALVRHKRCYLEEPQWMNLYMSLPEQPGLRDDRSYLAVKMRSQMFKLPGLWQEVEDVITGTNVLNDNITAELRIKLRKVHDNLLEWYGEYRTYCLTSCKASRTASELYMRREMLGVGLECLAVVKRLLATICDDEREKLEDDAQKTAHLIFDLQKETSMTHSWLFSMHEIGVAQSIVLTRDQWRTLPSNCSDEDKRIAIREAYHEWNKILRGEH